jgi:hypothetical protein
MHGDLMRGAAVQRCSVQRVAPLSSADKRLRRPLQAELRVRRWARGLGEGVGVGVGLWIL